MKSKGWMVVMLALAMFCLSSEAQAEKVKKVVNGRTILVEENELKKDGVKPLEREDELARMRSKEFERRQEEVRRAREEEQRRRQEEEERRRQEEEANRPETMRPHREGGQHMCLEGYYCVADNGGVTTTCKLDRYGQYSNQPGRRNCTHTGLFCQNPDTEVYFREEYEEFCNGV